MTNPTKNLKFAGFSAVGVIMIIFVAAAISIAGWVVWRAGDDKSADTKASSAKSARPAAETYVGWKLYSSSLGKFSFKYPSDWEISGFRGDTPVGPGYTTGEVNGQETSIQLIHSEDARNQFGMAVDVTGAAQADYGSYADGNIADLKNGLALWISKQQDPSGAGRAGNCPTMQLVSDQSFKAQLSNGTALTLYGSFCWGQKSDPSYSYEQQVNSISFKQARAILASVVPN